jgi:hypothetical protein
MDLPAITDAIRRTELGEPLPRGLSAGDARFLQPAVPRALWPGAEQLTGLLEVLRRQPDLAIFDGALQCIGNSGQSASLSDLAAWLVRRAQDVGVERAASDLDVYISQPDFEGLEVVAVGGIRVPGRVTLYGDTEILPFEQLPMSLNADTTSGLGRSGGKPHVVLCAPRRFVKHHGHDASQLTADVSRSQELVDLCAIITLTGPHSATPIGHWTQAAPQVPLGDLGSFLSLYREPYHAFLSPMLTTDQLHDAGELYAAFSQRLKIDAQEHLRVALDRFNRAKSRSRPVDSAIELGIALESLFLNDMTGDRGELNFRLRTRVARLLQSELEARRDVSGLVGYLYEIRSQAVHTGRVRERRRGSYANTRELLTAGYELTARAIRSLIERGGPIADWTAIDLG